MKTVTKVVYYKAETEAKLTIGDAADHRIILSIRDNSIESAPPSWSRWGNLDFKSKEQALELIPDLSRSGYDFEVIPNTVKIYKITEIHTIEETKEEV